jgi:hypothetical protein
MSFHGLIEHSLLLLTYRLCTKCNARFKLSLLDNTDIKFKNPNILKSSCVAWETSMVQGLMEAEDIVGICCQATASEDIEVLMFGVMICRVYRSVEGACGSVVGWGTILQAGRSPVLVPDEVDFFNLPNPSSCTMALRSTQPLKETSTRQLVHTTDNLTTICELTV